MRKEATGFNRIHYSLITLAIVVVFGVGVYALGTTVPNPGHSISQLQVCGDGQILQTSGTSWTCVAMPTGGTSVWTPQTYGISYSGRVGIGSAPIVGELLYVQGSIGSVGRISSQGGISTTKDLNVTEGISTKSLTLGESSQKIELVVESVPIGDNTLCAYKCGLGSSAHFGLEGACLEAWNNYDGTYLPGDCYDLNVLGKICLCAGVR